MPNCIALFNMPYLTLSHATPMPTKHYTFFKDLERVDQIKFQLFKFDDDLDLFALRLIQFHSLVLIHAFAVLSYLSIHYYVMQLIILFC
jgi:hypothetical protein